MRSQGSEPEFSELVPAVSPFLPLPLPPLPPLNMHRRGLFAQRRLPLRLNDPAMDISGFSSDDSFGGESLDAQSFRIFDLVSIDVSSPTPTERRTHGTDAMYGHTDVPGSGGYGDDIDEYPEYGNQLGANENGDPPHWDPGTREL